MKNQILIIEDEAQMSGILKDILEEYDYSVDCVDTGTQGIERAITDNPTLIILDLGLKGMDGVQVCRTLKENHQTSEIPIIIYTGQLGTELAEEAKKVGADEYMSKTVAPIKMIETVHKYMS